MNEFVRELKESAAGLHDGMGGHADHCAALMEKAAKRIAEMEENATDQALALKAAKAMQQAETERADRLQKYVFALEHDQRVGFAAVNSLTARLDVASKRADANERDAKRYRYIRTKERMMLETDDGEARMTTTFSSADEFDDAIDQVMSDL